MVQMKILLTGAAGFIGMHVAQRLLARGDTVIAVDNLNDYYDVRLKKARLACLLTHEHFHFHVQDIAHSDTLEALFKKEQVDSVIHLAGQAGVRYSLQNPHAYIDANLKGFLNVLEGCRHHAVKHLVYASSSSVYGGNTSYPFSEAHHIDHPVSLYAASKKSNELMAHTYSHLFGIPTTGLRFFTVYGPWGRPDMAMFLFTKAIVEGQPIKVFNHGELIRDFTYIDDVVEGVLRVLDKPATANPNFDASHPDPASSMAPYRVFNLGNSQPIPLMRYIEAIESSVGKKAEKIYLPMQPGDVLATSADTSRLYDWIGFKPNTSVEEGVRRYVQWYLEYQAEEREEAMPSGDVSSHST